jgi:hypothetical protein
LKRLHVPSSSASAPGVLTNRWKDDAVSDTLETTPTGASWSESEFALEPAFSPELELDGVLVGEVDETSLSLERFPIDFYSDIRLRLIYSLT